MNYEERLINMFKNKSERKHLIMGTAGSYFQNIIKTDKFRINPLLDLKTDVFQDMICSEIVL